MEIGGNSALYAMMDLLRRPAAVPDRPAGSAIGDMLAQMAGGPVRSEAVSSSGQGAGSAINDMIGEAPASRQDSLQLSGGARSALSLAAFG